LFILYIFITFALGFKCIRTIMTKKNTKCIVLARVSTEKQSYDEQIYQLKHLAMADGYSDGNIIVVQNKEHAVGITSRKQRKLGLIAGLRECEELLEKDSSIDAIYCWEVTRIARTVSAIHDFKDMILDYKRDHGRTIQLVVKEPAIRLYNSEGKVDQGAQIIFALVSQLAEMEMENKKARFARAKEEMFRTQKYTGGWIPRGYKLDKDNYIVVNEEEANVIRAIFSDYISGLYTMKELAEKYIANGFLTVSNITNAKATILHILSNPIFIGDKPKQIMRDGERIDRKITYPRIIDQETWQKCAQRREELLCRPAVRGEYLLNGLIRCDCGSSYIVNKIDGCYGCRIKHLGTEKGLQHSPNIQANVIESLAWYVALQELSSDLAKDRESTKCQILALKQEALYRYNVAEKAIRDMELRMQKLDEQFDNQEISIENYERRTHNQRQTIQMRQAECERYQKEIDKLDTQLRAVRSFNDKLAELAVNFDSLKNGAEYVTMKSLVQKYITEIRIEPVQGKLTSYWKKVIIHTIHDEENAKHQQELNQKGMDDIARTLSNVFYVDVFHRLAYWDTNFTELVPFVYIERIKKTRLENRKNRKRSPIKQHQY
jgi:DNA invertase Pin-like site-specific DNA recombinase